MSKQRQIGLCSTFLIALWTMPGHSEQPDADPLRALSDKAMAKLKDNDLPGVFEVLQAHGKWTEDQRTDAIEDWKKRREKAAMLIGKPVGEIEFLKKEVLGKCFVRYTYLEKWEKHALVWRLIYYKPKDEWNLQGIGWDESVPLLFEPAK